MLPAVPGFGLQNRFVGDHLLYGAGSAYYYYSPEEEDGEDRESKGKVVVHHLTGERETEEIEIGHGVERIDLLGSDAIVIGNDESDLVFSSLKLGGETEISSSYVLKNAAQGEQRSHGFFYKAQSENHGMLGLPVVRYDQSSAEILFLEYANGQLSSKGALSAEASSQLDDNCVMSCVDWYGNARPIFYKDRIFGLLGYEMVEGFNSGSGSVLEVRRTNFLTAD